METLKRDQINEKQFKRKVKNELEFIYPVSNAVAPEDYNKKLTIILKKEKMKKNLFSEIDDFKIEIGKMKIS